MMSQILQLMHKITIVRLLIRLFHVSDNTNYSVYRCTGVLNKIVNCNLPIQEWTQSPLTDWLQGHETINCELSVTTSKVEVTWLKVDVRAWQKHHSHPLGSMIEQVFQLSINAYSICNKMDSETMSPELSEHDCNNDEESTHRLAVSQSHAQKHQVGSESVTISYKYTTRGQSNLTKSASRGAHSPVRGHPRWSKVVPLNSVSYQCSIVTIGLGCTVWPQCTRVTTNQPTNDQRR